ncbi:MAG TPA: FAD-binding oxidoreductase [Longimicrobiaceae bacterium]
MGMQALRISTRDGEFREVPATEIERLQGRIAGRLLRRTEPEWAESVRLWNGMVRKEPALVVRPGSTRDVAEVIDFVRERGLLLSVKGGGHNIAGTAIAENGVLLDLIGLREVRVRPAARLADVGAGCRIADVDRATQEHSLATVLGFISETGVAGLTLGGGLGYLARRFGWTVDNLEEVEIVTADGRVRLANRREHEDLFWGIRGAGANLGAVTRFTFRLHRVGPTAFGGLIAWPFDRVREVLDVYRETTARAPRELAVWMVLLHAPPTPFVPADWVGKKICAMAVTYTGDPARADAAAAPIRRLGDPVFDLLREQPYTELQSYLDGTEPAGMHNYWKTEFLPGLSDQLFDTIVSEFAACELEGAEVGILHLEGALNERPEDDGAVGNRNARYVIGAKALWAPDDPAGSEYPVWVRNCWTRVRPFSTGRTYINFQTADEGDERIRATYGSNFERLLALKEKYDPDNIFRSNRNVTPALHRPIAASGSS